MQLEEADELFNGSRRPTDLGFAGRQAVSQRSAVEGEGDERWDMGLLSVALVVAAVVVLKSVPTQPHDQLDDELLREAEVASERTAI